MIVSKVMRNLRWVLMDCRLKVDASEKQLSEDNDASVFRLINEVTLLLPHLWPGPQTP